MLSFDTACVALLAFSIWDIKPFFIFTVTFSVLFVSTAVSGTLFLRNHPPPVFNYYLTFFLSELWKRALGHRGLYVTETDKHAVTSMVFRQEAEIFYRFPPSNGEKCPSTSEFQRCRLKYRSCVWYVIIFITRCCSRRNLIIGSKFWM